MAQTGDEGSGTRMRLRAVLILLAVSAVLNVIAIWTWLRRTDSRETTREVAAEAVIDRVSRDSPHPVVLEPRATPVPAPAREANASDDGARKCRERVAELERLLVKVQPASSPRESAKQRFARGAPDRTSEERVRPLLARAFSDVKIGQWSVECRDRVCRIGVTMPWEKRLEDVNAWMQKMQTDRELRSWVDFGLGMAFGGSAPGYDASTREGTWEHEVYMGVRNEVEPPDEIGPKLRLLTADLERSEMLDLCTRGYSEKGTFAAQISLDPTGLSFRFGGTLVPTDAGACLADRIRALASERLGRENPKTQYMSMARFTSPPAAVK